MRRLVMSAWVVALAACTPSHEKTQAAASAPVADPRMRVGVDRRVEIFSILFCLAGNDEYSRQAIATPYSKAMLAHFTPYIGHIAVVASKQLHDKFGVGFEQPITLAVQLDDALEPVQPLNPLPEGLSATWKNADLDKYLGMVRDFVARSRFDDFWREQQPYLAKIDAAWTAYTSNKGLLPWFDGVFGRKEKATYRIAPAMLSGPHNWGVHAVRADGTEEVLQAMSLIAVDGAGIPQLTDDTAWLLGHELAHPYVNPMVDRHMATLAAPLEAAFDREKDAMVRLHYTTPAIVGYESVARAIQVMYVSDRLGKEAAKKVLDDLVTIGFVWSPALVTALDRARAKNEMRLSEDAIITALSETLTAIR
ncbi:MAG TPA: DUF4932 domain-containing protein [Polyangiaceae bacterium]|nr:DUF4932 domain-containing protein [Polyangiaceae bacterium]